MLTYPIENYKGTRFENELSYEIISAAIEVHRTLGGPGLLESIYESALVYELSLRKLDVQRQKSVEVLYKNVLIREPMYLDILVEGKVIIEVKATEQDLLVHRAQILTYLRLTGLKLGLLINFGKEYLRDGIERVVNKL